MRFYTASCCWRIDGCGQTHLHRKNTQGLRVSPTNTDASVEWHNSIYSNTGPSWANHTHCQNISLDIHSFYHWRRHVPVQDKQVKQNTHLHTSSVQTHREHVVQTTGGKKERAYEAQNKLWTGLKLFLSGQDRKTNIHTGQHWQWSMSKKQRTLSLWDRHMEGDVSTLGNISVVTVLHGLYM